MAFSSDRVNSGSGTAVVVVLVVDVVVVATVVLGARVVVVVVVVVVGAAVVVLGAVVVAAVVVGVVATAASVVEAVVLSSPQPARTTVSRANARASQAARCDSLLDVAECNGFIVLSPQGRSSSLSAVLISTRQLEDLMIAPSVAPTDPGFVSSLGEYGSHGH